MKLMMHSNHVNVKITAMVSRKLSNTILFNSVTAAIENDQFDRPFFNKLLNIPMGNF